MLPSLVMPYAHLSQLLTEHCVPTKSLPALLQQMVMSKLQRLLMLHCHQPPPTRKARLQYLILVVSDSPKKYIIEIIVITLELKLVWVSRIDCNYI